MSEHTNRMTNTESPHSPTDLPRAAWWGAVKRSVGEFRRDNVTDWAAALTYYSILSIFPAMLVVVSLVGLAGKSVSRSLVTNVGELAPGAAVADRAGQPRRGYLVRLRVRRGVHARVQRHLRHRKKTPDLQDPADPDRG